MKSPYKLFGKRKSRSLQQECANLAGGPGSDPKATAARAQGREPGEMNESSEFNPKNKAKQGSSGMFYLGPKPVAGVNRNPVKKLGMFKADPPGTKTKVFGGRGTVDASTDAGKKILKEIKSIKTVKSSDPGRVTKSGASKAKKILKKADNVKDRLDLSKKLLKLGKKASVVTAMFDPLPAGKGSTTLDKDKYDLMKNIKD